MTRKRKIDANRDLKSLFSARRISFVRSVFVALVLTVSVTAAGAQSQAFRSMKYKFRGHENVFHFKASGLVARAAMRIAGEHEFRKAIRHVSALSFITVPKESFHSEKVSVKGLKNLVLKDAYEPLVIIHDQEDEVTIYIREARHKKNNRYFLLIDSSDEVVAIEIQGFIDPDHLRKHSQMTVNR